MLKKTFFTGEKKKSEIHLSSSPNEGVEQIH